MLQKKDELLDTYLSLRAKYKKTQEHYAKLRQHYVREAQMHYASLRHRYLLIACAWCQRRIRWQRKASSVVGETSHGICLPCATRLLTQLSARAVGSPAVAECAWHYRASVGTGSSASPGASS